MIEHKLFNISLFLLLLYSGALSGDLSLTFTVRDGDKVNLPCQNRINNHHNCHTTTWLFTDSRSTAAVELVNHGQLKETAKSDRLSVTAECSLVIKKVTAEDVGRYTCRQFIGNPGTQQGPDAVVHLSVVVMTEKKNADKVTLSCSVSTFDRCRHKVKWIHNRRALDRDYSNLKTSQSSCSATVTFLNLTYGHISSSDFKCSLKRTENNKEQLFTFSHHSSGEETNTATTVKLDTMTTIKELEIMDGSTNLPEINAAATIKLEMMTESGIKGGLTTKQLEIMNSLRKLPDWSWYRLAIVALGLVALIAAVVVVSIWIRAGKKAQMDENMEQNLNSAVTSSAPGTNQESVRSNSYSPHVFVESAFYTLLSSLYVVFTVQADVQDVVLYASLSYTETTYSCPGLQVPHKDDEEGEAVTYIICPVSSPGPAPINLYASINKPKN
ncbi:uncharacterized protein LOC100707140 isoform X1 [Oreochromis niloticus]|uniref:uncharacterized protein LOC100707140 isoform X1 n=1 Tax=Oreochromis niloticus TaxID=8128 RepID=UPI000905A363|nr:uncharacterized protein LOC100707140 isoform X1 [Oreochromis niloticus]